uniref:Uncharacterized protein n=1 Tax=Arundo donax TaxID=35708 RepID=A0A0A9HTD5_ARUDO
MHQHVTTINFINISIILSQSNNYDVTQRTSGTHIHEGWQFELIYSMQKKPNHTTRARPE